MQPAYAWIVRCELIRDDRTKGSLSCEGVQTRPWQHFDNHVLLRICPRRSSVPLQGSPFYTQAWDDATQTQDLKGKYPSAGKIHTKKSAHQLPVGGLKKHATTVICLCNITLHTGPTFWRVAFSASSKHVTMESTHSQPSKSWPSLYRHSAMMTPIVFRDYFWTWVRESIESGFYTAILHSISR